MNLRMNDIETRKQAMDWWNALSDSQKSNQCIANYKAVGICRQPESLTGREIQKLYALSQDYLERYSREDLHKIANWMWRECGEPEGFSRDRVHDYIEKHLKK